MRSFGHLGALFAYTAAGSRRGPSPSSPPAPSANPAPSTTSTPTSPTPLTACLMHEDEQATLPEYVHFPAGEHTGAVPTRKAA